ncbi:hypothetical protein [Dyella sp.]|jgi:hypothetical protein|uniref:hypothetical protein n=1 Tax=Dyella sp. TaxID=1869338 RepID=UPI002D77BAC0|nr:hypothetical protein [Dyella sp.]HET6431449.1 hypothetical protein [Dyella sp.]
MRIRNRFALVLASMLGASGACMAQAVHQDVIPTRVSRPPKATQLKRCENFGALVKMAAEARDDHVPQRRFISRFGPKTLGPGLLGVIETIYASSENPGALQTQMQRACEAHVS